MNLPGRWKFLWLTWAVISMSGECKMKRRGICTHCDPCDIMCGVGGAGTYSDGTLNLRPDIGGDLAEQTGDPEYAWSLLIMWIRFS